MPFLFPSHYASFINANQLYVSNGSEPVLDHRRFENLIKIRNSFLRKIDISNPLSFAYTFSRFRAYPWNHYTGVKERELL